MTIPANLGSATIYNAALSNLSRTTSDIFLSTARLSSGNRLVRASDDIAALSIGSRLATQISGIKAAQQNTTQGNSFLQLAYAGLSSISDLLSEADALATQANSGSLTSTERNLLQQEFSALVDEIDRLADNTKFGEINLLDGTVSGENRQTSTTTQATQASGSITLSGNLSDGETVILNGTTFTARTVPTLDNEFEIGGTTDITVSNLATLLNTSTDTAISGTTFEAQTNTLLITQDSGGEAGNLFTIDQDSSTGSFTTNGAATVATDIYTLQDGADDGLHYGSVEVTGTIGDSLVNTQSQIQASTTLLLTGAVSDSETLSFDDGDGGLVAFTFRNAPSTSDEIQIGSTTEETLQNIISTVTQYTGDDTYGLDQLEFERDGDSLIIRSRVAGDPVDIGRAVLDVAEGITNASLTSSTLASGENTGIDARGVNNASFVGTVSGFTATYAGADSLTASVTVGSSTYTAAITDTTPGSATPVRFNSSDGGYFDVELATGGLSVANQTNADTFASRLNGAFATLGFNQARGISSFSGVNGLVAGSAEARLDSFSDLNIENITVTAASGSTDAVVELTLNGEIFRSSDIGSSLGTYETITLTNTQNANESIRITAGSSTNDLSSSTVAATFQESLRESFGLNGRGVGLDFKVGTENDDIINVRIADVRSSKLFDGTAPTIESQVNAALASTALDTAITRVGQALADVGALQSRFDSAYSNLENSRIYLDEARSNLLDTDIAEESTNFALAQLRANSATAVLAQTKQLQGGLLEILRQAS